MQEGEEREREKEEERRYLGKTYPGTFCLQAFHSVWRLGVTEVVMKDTEDTARSKSELSKWELCILLG